LNKSSFSHPSSFVMENARQKALDVMKKLKTENLIPDLLVSADTIVSLENTILEKPMEKEDARQMLKSLSGREHVVYTGVCIFVNDVPEPVTFFEETIVEFGELNDQLIDAYIATGEPFDKAGGYGIQDKGAMLVKSIKGCYFNVMGFPLYRFCKELAEILENKVL
jgi:septum formation protein